MFIFPNNKNLSYQKEFTYFGTHRSNSSIQYLLVLFTRLRTLLKWSDERGYFPVTNILFNLVVRNDRSPVFNNDRLLSIPLPIKVSVCLETDIFLDWKGSDLVSRTPFYLFVSSTDEQNVVLNRLYLTE